MGHSRPRLRGRRLVGCMWSISSAVAYSSSKAHRRSNKIKHSPRRRCHEWINSPQEHSSSSHSSTRSAPRFTGTRSWRQAYSSPSWGGHALPCDRTVIASWWAIPGRGSRRYLSLHPSSPPNPSSYPGLGRQRVGLRVQSPRGMMTAPT